MPEFVTPAAANLLQNSINRFKSSVPAPSSGNWERLDDGELWAAVIGQISVVGGANSGELLKAELANDLTDWYDMLLGNKPKARLRSIHKRLHRAGVRYVTDSMETCKKSRAASYNFELLESYGGPKTYFTKLAKVSDESWRIGIVSSEMQYIRSKGARDLLIGLGLVENAIALDSRLRKVLTKVGVAVPADLSTNQIKYKLLELELLHKICNPCHVTGAHFDRILFSKWKEVG